MLSGSALVSKTNIYGVRFPNPLPYNESDCGRVAERSKATSWKGVERETAPQVRILSLLPHQGHDMRLFNDFIVARELAEYAFEFEDFVNLDVLDEKLQDIPVKVINTGKPQQPAPKGKTTNH